MTIVYEKLMALDIPPTEQTYTSKDCMLYALGIGLGHDPMNEDELPFVYERNLTAVPTLASVVAWGAAPGNMNINFMMVVDGERDITFHKPLAVAAHITADSTVLDVFDKGKDKGAVIRHQTVLKNEKGEELATLVASRFARGDGGRGGGRGGGFRGGRGAAVDRRIVLIVFVALHRMSESVTSPPCARKSKPSSRTSSSRLSC